MSHQEFDKLVPYGRHLSQKPTQEIASLVKVIPRLYDYDIGEEEACATATDNFLGSMVLMLHRKRFTDIFKKAGFEPPERIQTPIEVFENIPLVDQNNHPLEITVPTIVAKQGVGNRLAVVTDGPYAGLILRRQYHKDCPDGMRVIRIWNEVPIISIYPDVPKFNSGKNVQNTNFNAWYMANNEAVHRLFYELFREERKRLQEKIGSHLSSSQVFMMICRELQIPFDKTRFHSTQS